MRKPLRIAPNEVGQKVLLDQSEVMADLLDDWDPRLMRQHVAKMMEDDWVDSEMGVYDQ